MSGAAFGASALSSGIQATNNLIATGLNIYGNYKINEYNNREARLREAEARAENYKYGELAANAADARTRQLYEDLYSPAAQLQQLKEAGLSPSLFYGDGGGISGQAGAQGNGAAGIAPTVFGMGSMNLNPLDIAGIRLANAQADKLEAETKTENETREPQIAKLLAEAGYTEAATQVQKAQNAGIQLDNYVKEHTQDANIAMICDLAEKASYEATEMYYKMLNTKLAQEFNAETYDKRVEQARLQVDEIAQAIAESKSRVSLNAQQKQYLRNEVLKSFDEVAQGWKELDIKERNTQSYADWIEAQIPNIQKQLDIRLKELGIEKRRLYIEAITETLRAVGQTAVALSIFNGKGGDLTPPKPTPNKIPHNGGKAIKEGVPIHKNNTIWEY